uniref:T-cell activation Rho GTPase-activating protein n=1 Tax=Euleptes europaea TaxID=460621 RepID=UPI0025420631|nr:T-cell activation Rho GTPase-activating protein [Euleptes europaea]
MEQHKMHRRNNLPKKDWDIIEKLANRPEIVIKPDKGGAIVVLSRDDYDNEVRRQLNNTQFYQRMTRWTKYSLLSIRYVDDVFLAMYDSQSFAEFNLWINERDPNIKLNGECNISEIPFLDVSIYKKPNAKLRDKRDLRIELWLHGDIAIVTHEYTNTEKVGFGKLIMTPEKTVCKEESFPAFLQRRRKPKPLNASDMETWIACQSEGDIKKCQLLVPCDGEDGLCHLIDSNKKRKKVISWPFVLRRTFTGPETLGHLAADLKPSLFDQPLSMVCTEEDTLPKPILDILTILYMKGPSTEGIFRKAANEKARKELKEELNAGGNVVLENEPVHLLAVIFKDFLRNIPQKLLLSELYDEWMTALEKISHNERTEAMKEVAGKLPQPNLVLLKGLLCVLRHISQNAAVNKMDSNNLAICVGPSILTPDHNQHLPLEAQKELTDKVKTLVEFLIDNCSEIFGEDNSLLFSISDDDSLDKSEMLSPSQQNDSAYDSTDLEGDCNSSDFQDKDVQEAKGPASRLNSIELQSHHPQSQTASVTSLTPLNNSISQLDRRYSEPDMFSSQACQEGSMKSQKLTKSEEDFVHQKELGLKCQRLSKQMTRELYLPSLHRNKKPPNLTIKSHLHSELSTNSLARSSSNNSLDCSSPASDSSVFTCSPLTSPSGSKKNAFTRPQSFSTKTAFESDTSNQEPRKHSMSFSVATRKKELTKTQSCSIVGFQRGSFKKDSKRERNLSCRVIQGTCTNSYNPGPAGCQLRPRFFSADEVFRFVDQKNPGKPPSYKEAIKNCSAARLPSYSSLTVQNMRSAQLHPDSQPQRPRPDREVPNKVHKDIFQDKRSVISNPKDKMQAADVVIGIHSRANLPLTPQVYRLRTMSGSYQKNKQEYLTRRCSQPTFDHILCAKESYV